MLLLVLQHIVDLESIQRAMFESGTDWKIEDWLMWVELVNFTRKYACFCSEHMLQNWPEIQKVPIFGTGKGLFVFKNIPINRKNQETG